MNAPANHTTIAFAEDELVGKLMYTLVMQLEGQKVAWPLTAEKNQEIFLAKARENITAAVRAAVATIVTNRIPAVTVTLEKVVFDGDGIEAKITMGKQIGAHELADAAGQRAYILLADPDRFTAGGEKVTGKPDQPALDLESAPDFVDRGGTWSVMREGVIIPGGAGPDGNGFPTKEDAEKWYAEKSAPKGDGIAPPTATPPAHETAGQDQQPSILELKDGGYRIVIGDKKPYTFLEGQPAEPFKTHAEAEAWLQDHLGIGKEPPKLDDALAVFKQEGRNEAEKPQADRDLEVAFNRAAEKFPSAFIEEYRAELDTAVAEGYDDALTGAPAKAQAKADQQKPDQSKRRGRKGK